MLKTAVRLFIEEADRMRKLKNILEESRYRKDDSGRWLPHIKSICELLE